MEHDLDFYCKIAGNLAKEVGEIIRNRIWTKKEHIETKSHATDFVTETDQQVEKLLITGLSNHFPDHKFIGEESTSAGARPDLTDAPTWIIDPVDGTMNFVHGYPNVCVSIGLTIKKIPVIGIIYVPVPDMFFSAIKGKGAFLNNKPIHASKTKDLKDALLATEFSGASSNKARLEASVIFVQTFLPVVHAIRQSGSAAYNLAMTALGAADVYFEVGIHAWDIAAGAVLVTEAGGVALDPNGGPLDLMARKVLCAGTNELALQLSKCIDHSCFPPLPRDDA